MPKQKKKKKLNFGRCWRTEWLGAGHMSRIKRKKAVSEESIDGLSPPEHICSLLRDIQWKTNCSTLTLQCLLDSLRGNLGHAIKDCNDKGFELPRLVDAADKKMSDTVCLIH